jgi:hypothetical protein
LAASAEPGGASVDRQAELAMNRYAIQKRSAGLIRAGGTLVTITGPAEARPADGLAIDFGCRV